MIRLNKSAMRSLSTNCNSKAQSALREARGLLESHPDFHRDQYEALVNLTLNNQACYYST